MSSKGLDYCLNYFTDNSLNPTIHEEPKMQEETNITK